MPAPPSGRSGQARRKRPCHALVWRERCDPGTVQSRRGARQPRSAMGSRHRFRTGVHRARWGHGAVRRGRAPPPGGPRPHVPRGARTVTGSRFLVETETARVLADCGLQQGEKEPRLRDWKPLPVPPAAIDALVVTHAHVDHRDYLPGLVARASPPGAGYPRHRGGRRHRAARQRPPAEEDASYASRKGFSKHHPPLPLYTHVDARRALPSLRALAFGRPQRIAESITLTLRPAGHILGSRARCSSSTETATGPRSGSSSAATSAAPPTRCSSRPRPSAPATSA